MRAEEPRRRQTEREIEARTLKAVSVAKYGEKLGSTFFDYAHGQPSDASERTLNRKSFAEAVVSVLFETQGVTREERVNAMTALMEAFEAKLAPVASQARRVDFMTRPMR